MAEKKLDQLKKMTTIVCDTGDINSIKKYNPTDATTNPSLIFAAAQEAQYYPLVDDAIRYGQQKSPDEKHLLTFIMDKLFVNFGLEILKIVPGRVSTEVDARLSFDVKGSMQKALTLVHLYESAGIHRNRILIKLASTWEGIVAARALEQEGIHCNMTLIFDLAQAIACADAKTTLISPFVGRIFDWYKTHEKKESYPADKDPGVLSVQSIYNYFKKYDYTTQVMGASFRNVGEILELAGCDLLTIAPNYLQEIQGQEGLVERKLSLENAKKMPIDKINVDERVFRWHMNENQMATEKLSEGIRKFGVDQVKLEKFVMDRLQKVAK